LPLSKDVYIFTLKVGDLLQLNCTSEPSNPAADLKWEINKELVPEQHYIFNEKISHEKKLWISRKELLTHIFLISQRFVNLKSLFS
jgi:hypothetical protein